MDLNFEFRGTSFFGNPEIALYIGPASLAKPGATFDKFKNSPRFLMWQGVVTDVEGAEPTLRVVDIEDIDLDVEELLSKISTDFDMSVCFEVSPLVLACNIICYRQNFFWCID